MDEVRVPPILVSVSMLNKRAQPIALSKRRLVIVCPRDHLASYSKADPIRSESLPLPN